MTTSTASKVGSSLPEVSGDLGWVVLEDEENGSVGHLAQIIGGASLHTGAFPIRGIPEVLKVSDETHEAINWSSVFALSDLDTKPRDSCSFLGMGDISPFALKDIHVFVRACTRGGALPIDKHLSGREGQIQTGSGVNFRYPWTIGRSRVGRVSDFSEFAAHMPVTAKGPAETVARLLVTNVRAADESILDKVSLFARPDLNGPPVLGSTLEAVENVTTWLREHATSTFAAVADDGLLSLSAVFQSGVRLFIEVDRDGSSEATVALSRSDVRALEVSTVTDLTPWLMEDAVGSS